jgi:hypothetical protein
MGRFEDTEAAIAQRLRAMKAKPEMTINLVEFSTPLTASGYTQDEIAPGNRLRLIKPLP